MLALSIYLLLVVAASLAGGWIPRQVRLTHARLQLAVSFVAGLMLGVALLHLLPHAALYESHGDLDRVVGWLLAGVLAMFLLERFFCFHHHDAPDESEPDEATHKHAADCGHDHGEPRAAHELTWAGAAVGLGLHSLIDGVALAASTAAEAHSATWWAGLGAFLVVFLHKPFDSMTIGTLLAHGRYAPRVQTWVNLLFAAATPLGALLFQIGATQSGLMQQVLAPALAFSAGTFLCVSLSDLLPELQFHRHDRVKLTVAMLAGLTVAWSIGLAEGEAHGHEHEPAPHAHVE